MIREDKRDRIFIGSCKRDLEGHDAMHRGGNQVFSRENSRHDLTIYQFGVILISRQTVVN